MAQHNQDDTLPENDEIRATIRLYVLDAVEKRIRVERDLLLKTLGIAVALIGGALTIIGYTTFRDLREQLLSSYTTQAKEAAFVKEIQSRLSLLHVKALVDSKTIEIARVTSANTWISPEELPTIDETRILLDTLQSEQTPPEVWEAVLKLFCYYSRGYSSQPMRDGIRGVINTLGDDQSWLRKDQDKLSRCLKTFENCIGELAPDHVVAIAHLLGDSKVSQSVRREVLSMLLADKLSRLDFYDCGLADEEGFKSLMKLSTPDTLRLFAKFGPNVPGFVEALDAELARSEIPTDWLSAILSDLWAIGRDNGLSNRDPKDFSDAIARLRFACGKRTVKRLLGSAIASYWHEAGIVKSLNTQCGGQSLADIFQETMATNDVNLLGRYTKNIGRIQAEPEWEGVIVQLIDMARITTADGKIFDKTSSSNTGLIMLSAPKDQLVARELIIGKSTFPGTSIRVVTANTFSPAQIKGPESEAFIVAFGDAGVAVTTFESPEEIGVVLPSFTYFRANALVSQDKGKFDTLATTVGGSMEVEFDGNVLRFRKEFVIEDASPISDRVFFGQHVSVSTP